MKIKVVPGVAVAITTEIPATELPIVLKNEEGEVTYAFSKNPNGGKVTTNQFVGNTAVDGKLALAINIGEEWDRAEFIEENSEALLAASEAEAAAVEQAAKTKTKKEQDAIKVAAMFQ